MKRTYQVLNQIKDLNEKNKQLEKNVDKLKNFILELKHHVDPKIFDMVVSSSENKKQKTVKHHDEKIVILKYHERYRDCPFRDDKSIKFFSDCLRQYFKCHVSNFILDVHFVEYCKNYFTSSSHNSVLRSQGEPILIPPVTSDLITLENIQELFEVYCQKITYENKNYKKTNSSENTTYLTQIVYLNDIKHWVLFNNICSNVVNKNIEF